MNAILPLETFKDIFPAKLISHLCSVLNANQHCLLMNPFPTDCRGPLLSMNKSLSCVCVCVCVFLDFLFVPLSFLYHPICTTLFCFCLYFQYLFGLLSLALLFLFRFLFFFNITDKYFIKSSSDPHPTQTHSCWYFDWSFLKFID